METLLVVLAIAVSAAWLLWRVRAFLRGDAGAGCCGGCKGCGISPESTDCASAEDGIRNE
ncbi:MAG: FeoB-associated Cys-rich membrane protein [Lentisphaeria bacterium]|nr:FeoB-associated Cys-rich membrane protein [Lentisphaeria bacterium]